MSLRDKIKNGFVLSNITVWLYSLWLEWTGIFGLDTSDRFENLCLTAFLAPLFPLTGFIVFGFLSRRSAFWAWLGAWLGMLLLFVGAQSVSYGEYITFVQGTIAGFTLAFMLDARETSPDR